MDINGAFPCIARGRLIHAIKANKIEGDLTTSTESYLASRTVEMIIKADVLPSHPMETGVPQSAPVLLILFAIHPAGLMKWVEERVQAKGLSFVDDLRWGATGKDVNQVDQTSGA